MEAQTMDCILAQIFENSSTVLPKLETELWKREVMSVVSKSQVDTLSFLFHHDVCTEFGWRSLRFATASFPREQAGSPYAGAFHNPLRLSFAWLPADTWKAGFL